MLALTEFGRKVKQVQFLLANDSNSEYSAALGKAKSYNSLFHMSKKRMYRQLTSDFDKFSNDAAQYAIDHLDD
ncbi:TPA: Ltp family lipoprotein [Streptococcus pneumoniae]|nr:Ltp family lipoprotein [Streptococcus pneumoniae]